MRESWPRHRNIYKMTGVTEEKRVVVDESESTYCWKRRTCDADRSPLEEGWCSEEVGVPQKAEGVLEVESGLEAEEAPEEAQEEEVREAPHSLLSHSPLQGRRLPALPAALNPVWKKKTASFYCQIMSN